ncbi:hypothetical protein ILYODFUR_019230, partial [Ilyodon furcidens]
EKKEIFRALETILQGTELEVKDSSDSSLDLEVDEYEKLLQDLVHYQKKAGPSGSERTQPSSTWVEAISSSSSDNGA